MFTLVTIAKVLSVASTTCMSLSKIADSMDEEIKNSEKAESQN